MIHKNTFVVATTSALLGAMLATAPALAAGPDQNGNSINNGAPASAKENHATTGSSSYEQTSKPKNKNDAAELVREATQQVKAMEKDPRLKKAMAKAKGIYLVPEFGRGALVVGARGGEGVVLAHVNGKWTNPVFYDFGAISFGAQAGGSGGQVAFLLMSKGAVDQFKSGNKVTLNADSGFTIVNYSANAEASWGKGDIIFWSDTAGAYAGATVSISDINFADNNNKTFYGRKVDPSAVLNGKEETPNAASLTNALPG
jgi:lipid-binding SYLF domain-containing protein